MGATAVYYREPITTLSVVKDLGNAVKIDLFFPDHFEERLPKENLVFWTVKRNVPQGKGI